MINNKDSKPLEIRYKNYNNTLQTIKRHAKENYYNATCNEHRNNTKCLWKTINQIIHKSNNKSEVVEKLKINNLDEHRGEQIVEEFASYFAEVGKKFANRMPNPKKGLKEYMRIISTQEKSIFLTPILSVEIERYIKNLKPKTSSGLDNINNKLLKELSNCICEPLAQIFSKSISSGIFPTKMKTSKVIPLHKGKSKDEATNYRPISLLITISKILEKAVYHRVYNFLVETNQLFCSQYRFCKNHSCDHAVGELVANITKGIEQGKITAAVFLDLSKAFDSLEILLYSVIWKNMVSEAVVWIGSRVA